MTKNRDFGEFLLVNSYIDARQLAEALKVTQGNGALIADKLVSMGVLSKVRLAEAVRKYLGIPEISLTQVIIDPSVAGLIPEEMARRYTPVSYTHLRAHETRHDLVCRLLLEK